MKLMIAATAGALAISAGVSQARVTKVVVDNTATLTATGQNIAYQQISGHAFGELDPALPLNAIIQDIGLAKDADGKVRYVASFVLTKPVDMTQASGMMWHDVPNRGSPIAINVIERNFGDIGLASAWQGDNAAIDTGNGTAVRATMLVGGRHWLKLPVAKNADGSAVTGSVFGRIVNRSGTGAQALIVQTNPVPYLPNDVDDPAATLVSRDGETMDGHVINEQPIARGDWKFCGGGTYDAPTPLTTLPVRISPHRTASARQSSTRSSTTRRIRTPGRRFAAWRDGNVLQDRGDGR
jgi:hypothetical protein